MSIIKEGAKPDFRHRAGGSFTDRSAQPWRRKKTKPNKAEKDRKKQPKRKKKSPPKLNCSSVQSFLIKIYFSTIKNSVLVSLKISPSLWLHYFLRTSLEDSGGSGAGRVVLGKVTRDPAHLPRRGLAVQTAPSALPTGPTRSYSREAGAAFIRVVPAIPRIMLPHVLDKMNLLKVLWSGRT